MSKALYYRTVSAFAVYALAGLSVAPGTLGAERHEIKPGMFVRDDQLNTTEDPKRVERLIAAGCLDPEPVDAPPVVTAGAAVTDPAATASGVAAVVPLGEPVNQKSAGNTKAREKPAPKAKATPDKDNPPAPPPPPPPPPPAAAFVEGDLVRLKSGGPDMLVEGYNEEGLVTATWEMDDKTAASGAFVPATLELVE